MKYLTLFILLFLLSCGRPPIDNTGVTIIQSVEHAPILLSKTAKICIYRVNISDDYFLKFRIEAYFCDTCGKYTVGDTIKISKK